jgi:hypothetical protein
MANRPVFHAWRAAVFCGGMLLLGSWLPAQNSKAPATPGTARPAPAPPCCYSNPQYTGACVVAPAKAETCASILAYLNGAQTAGKNYCGGTNVRGGWERAKCAGTKASPSPSPSPR